MMRLLRWAMAAVILVGFGALLGSVLARRTGGEADTAGAPPKAQTRAWDASTLREEADVREELLSRQKRYALIVGNSLYTKGFSTLDGVAEDLQTLPGVLKQAGFTVETRRDLSSQDLEPSIRSFVERYGSDPDNQLLVYFASHGATDSNGTGYIVPVDAPPPAADQIEFRRKSMSMNMLQAIAKDAIARHVLFVFDSCFAGTIFEGRRSATRSIREGFDQYTRFFITAGGADETVLDRSIFRDQFSRGILGAADANRDNFITDVELGAFLVQSVFDEGGAPHRPRWGWMTDARFDKGVWAMPVPGAFRPVDSSALALGGQAFVEGRQELALEIWSRYALAGDIRTMKHLGDVYSGAALEELGLTGPAVGAPTNPTLAMAWYARVIMWYVARDRHDIYRSEDRLLRQSLRAFTVLRGNSPASESETALNLAANMLETGGPDDFYALGMSYLIGTPVPYDQDRAMFMLKLAADRNQPAAAREYEARSTNMTEAARKNLESAVAAWSPPNPEAFVGDVKPSRQELERLRRELQEQKNQDGVAGIAEIDVELIQRALKSLGFYNGPIDNEAGPAFREAVRRFQVSRDADATGILTAEQTVDLIRSAAEDGHPMSAYVLGVMYARGVGVVSDGALAVKWLTVAANADLAIGHYALGVIYRDGTSGANAVQPDLKKAAMHFERAVALGYARAERDLAELALAPTPSVE